MAASSRIGARASKEAPALALRHEIEPARTLSDRLFALVRETALYDRPIAERHRVIFYVGHLEAFDWNLLKEPLAQPPFDRELDRLFAFGIDPLEGRGPTDEPSDWPRRELVLRYCDRVRRTLDRALEDAASSGASSLRDLEERLQVAAEHRLMHAETLAYMLHRMPFSAKAPPPFRAPERDVPEAPAPEMVEIPGGVATLGARREAAAFGWDNEFEAHEVEVPAFAIDRFMVTNAEFLPFVEGGGYEERRLWSEPAWQWIARAGIAHPAHWERDGGRWLYGRMFDRIALPPSWPVYVSHAEATAFARWKGKTLPSEAQWHRAAYGTPEGLERAYPWGASPPEDVEGNFDFRRFDPCEVDAFPGTRSAFGVAGLLGNGWEWTSTPFQPFRGFVPRPFYAGYSADFFDGAHYVLKGGSPRTAARLLRRSFRNWFQPHYPYVYAGFRCALD